MNKIKVVIVDDSKLYRDLIEHLLVHDPMIEIVGKAVDPFEARDIIKQTKPDVITLDIEMPKMNGLKFLKNLMRLHPLPVIMLSSLTGNGARESVKALELGAVDVMQKMTQTDPALLLSYRNKLIDKVKHASTVKVKSLSELSVSGRTAGTTASSMKTQPHLVAIGASTGGIPAIKKILAQLKANCIPVVITQHIQSGFLEAFVKLANMACKAEVVSATQGMVLKPGHVYLSPAEKDLRITKTGSQYSCTLAEQNPNDFYHPNVNALFSSVAIAAKNKACYIILTGMGNDGVAGLTKAKSSGSMIIAQDEQSSVVWGMPKAAIEAKLSTDVLSLDQICSFIAKLTTQLTSEAAINQQNTTTNATPSALSTPASSVKPHVQISRHDSGPLTLDIKQAMQIFIKQLSNEHHYLKAKLQQVEDLLRDAAKRSGPEVKKLQELDYDVSEIIRFLQVDDLLTQLIDKINVNIGGIQSHFDYLLKQFDSIKTDTKEKQFAAVITQLSEQLDKANSKLKRDSVSQTDLSSGDIDLF